MRLPRRLPVTGFALAVVALLQPVHALRAQGTRADYERAEQFLAPRVDSLVLNERVRPNWLGTSDRFWYVRALPDGREVVLVDPATAHRGPAFDHERLATALAEVLDHPVDARHLPIDRLHLSATGDTLTVEVDRARWQCYLAAYRCARHAVDEPPEGISPDGKWVAFVRDFDLFVRSTESGREIRLTHDGERDRAYATTIPSPTLMVRQQTDEPTTDPLVFWAPDSRHLATYRIDARGAGTLSMVQHAPPDRVRPRYYNYRYPLPEDSVLPTGDLYLFAVDAWTPTRVPIAPVVMQYYNSPARPRWAEDGSHLTLVVTDRGYTRRQVLEIDAASGSSRTVIDELGDPYVDVYGGTILEALDGGTVLWGSERDGWSHLYLYNGTTGAVERQLTRGNWVVRDVVHADKSTGTILFVAAGRETGRDPYLRHLYRTDLTGRSVRLLTPEDADHEVVVSPSGTYALDTYSRPQVEPVTVLRRTSDGAVVMDLERADVSGLLATGWRRSEPFAAKARDGTTDIYGLIWWPSTFDSTKRYPIVEQIYTGPHSFFVPKTFGAYRSTAQSIAELGFVVVQIDGLGTSGRGKAFHLYSWKNLGDGGLDDHIAALRQLAERRSYLDLSRVGIFGHSAGGYDAAHAMLTHPEFYKVGVSSAGNHDHRMDKAVWNTQWMGWPVGDHYRAQSNVTLAPRLEGKLLLAHGDVDENVPVSATLQLVNALIEANKDFDLLILPNQTHGLGRHAYFQRRRWDYFVEHLLGVEPPAGYRITAFDPPSGGQR
ncbi:MAG: S9 family peptidase [Gemmatimonadota bacterium]|nr:S9 family peptidase [Gemmatimonadota bacterium]